MADLEYRYGNALKWIRHIAGLHYFGAAFDPEHMRTLANVAADALDARTGRDLPDYEEAMTTAQVHAREMAESLGIQLLGADEEDDEENDATASVTPEKCICGHGGIALHDLNRAGKRTACFFLAGPRGTRCPCLVFELAA